MICPNCGRPFDTVPPEQLSARRIDSQAAASYRRPEPSKCSHCDYGTVDLLEELEKAEA